MTTTEFWKRFNNSYRKVATLGVYDEKRAFEIDSSAPMAINAPQHFLSFVEKHGCGCCLHYSWALIGELKNNGIEASWAVVPEPRPENKNAQKCVVHCTTPNGEEFIADPIEDVKAGVTTSAYIGNSCKWINSCGETVDNSKINLNELAKKEGYLRIYPSPNENEGFWDYYGRTDYREII